MKSRPSRSGTRLVGRLGDGGADPAAQPQPGDLFLAHDPGDPLVVDPPAGSVAVVELGGDPRTPWARSVSWIARIRSASAAPRSRARPGAGAAASHA